MPVSVSSLTFTSLDISTRWRELEDPEGASLTQNSFNNSSSSRSRITQSYWVWTSSPKTARPAHLRLRPAPIAQACPTVAAYTCNRTISASQQAISTLMQGGVFKTEATKLPTAARMLGFRSWGDMENSGNVVSLAIHPWLLWCSVTAISVLCGYVKLISRLIQN